ncbi:hypothetical protein [Streptomyces broussonetiae]|uniref:AG2 protein n=1 Tax=Streptomyces broussonetiae TaxID=2686304 RepID=A0A6I6N6I0_9ACTN|nr:hypothetical protein [Streptomyces broussonetiae]QHA06279.1 hypothetical protein GQF42_26055 [Streptomyces broussonetiae]
MPTYHEILTTDLSALTTAADRWDGMAGELHKQETAYQRDVHGITLSPQFVGESQQAANARFSIRLTEYQNAQTEAKAIAALLREANTQFVALRKKLESARDEAIAAGMKVSDQGLVSYDTGKLSQGDRQELAHDPDYQDSVRKSVASSQARIDQCVQDVNDADKGVEVALTAVVKGPDLGFGQVPDFNGKAQGSIEKYEADETKDIAQRVNSGTASPADYQELQRVFRDSAGDKVLSQTVLDDLGAKGTLDLSNTLDGLAYHSDRQHSGQYLDIQKSLAMTLATATQDPNSDFYKNFRADMQKAGTEQFKVDGLSPIPDEKVRGYQSLVTLMQQGHGYNGQFLEDTADDIRHAEESYAAKGNLQSIWALRDKFSGKDRGWFANDPLDGVLGIMSQDPKTSTAYLDPAHSDNLNYLMHNRDWNTVVDHFATPPGGTTVGMPVMAEDGDSRTGFGAALEAAATGHPPLTSGQDPWPEAHHDEAQTRVMADVLDQLKPSTGTNAPVPANLRQPIADALGEYASDTHNILAGVDSHYITSSNIDGSVSDGHGYFTDGHGVHLSVDPKTLTQVMRGLSDDPSAYATLQKAEDRHINYEMDQLPKGALHQDINAKFENFGAVRGTYSVIQEDIINDDRMSKYAAADWKAKVAYHVIGGALTPLYFTAGAEGPSIAYGDALQRGVDTVTWDMDNQWKAQADNEANAKVADTFLSANKDLPLMVNGWAEGRSDIDMNDPTTQTRIADLTTAALDGQTRGITNARNYLVDTTN